MKPLLLADLFCGAGGTSTGMLEAVRELGAAARLIAVNHWNIAVDTHRANHPEHADTTYQADLHTCIPSKLVPGKRLDLLWASPSCTHHSRARGGKPCDDQQRAQPELILTWLNQLFVKRILIENVPDFIDWGPLGADGKPLKSKKGVLFADWCRSLEARGYRIEWRILNCADYGDATTRKRFFLQGVRGRGEIVWPEKTHARPAAPGLLPATEKPWVPTRDIIDWSDPGTSIFSRKRPLSQNTLRRIAAGIQKFWGPLAEPFLVILRGTEGGACNRSVQPITLPLPTVTAGGSHVGLVQPFLSCSNNWPGQREGRSVDDPLPTQTSGNHVGVVQPFVARICQTNGGAAVASAAEPLTTACSKQEHAPVQPFILPQFTDGRPRSVAEPVYTLTTESRGAALVELFIMDCLGTDRPEDSFRTLGPDESLPSFHAQGNRFGLVSPFLVEFYGTGGARSVDEPLGTAATHDRFGLVTPGVIDLRTLTPGRYWLDILFRMLQPHELAAAHSFPPDYRFAGTKTNIVAQIGNSVPRLTAQALVRAVLLAGFKNRLRQPRHRAALRAG